MKLFALGPVAMFPHTLEIASKQIPYFRTSEFSEIMLGSEQMLKQVTGAEPDAKVVFLTASGTGAMEATVFNCFNENDKLLVINGGIFGKRFVEICEAHNILHESINLKYGEVLSSSHFQKYSNKGFTGLLVNIHETSTGQLYNIELISKFCKENNLYLVVDAISSFMADPYDMQKYGIDVTILSTQKGLAVGPGMSLVILSNRIYEEKVKHIKSKILYFCFKEHIENQKRGQTPYTPAVRVAIEMNDMLKHIIKDGLENRLRTIKEVADDFRDKIKMTELKLPDFPISNAATPIIFPDNNAFSVYEILKNDFDTVLTPCGGDLKNIQVRVGHIGNHYIEENDKLIADLKKAISLSKGTL